MTSCADNVAYADVRTRICNALDVICSKRMGEVVLLIVIAIWLVFRMLSHTLFGSFFFENPIITESFVWHRVVLLCAFIELCCIWRQGYGKRDAVAVLVFALMAWGLFSNGYYLTMCDALVVFVARHSNFRRVLTFASVLVGIILVAVIMCSAIGIVQDIVMVQGNRVRHCLGFTYCLFPSQYLFVLVCALGVLRDGKVRWITLALLVVINAVLFLLTDGRLSFGLTLIALAVIAARKLPVVDSVWSHVARVSRWSFVFVIVVSSVLVGLYALMVASGGDWLVWLNKLASSRISIAYQGLCDLGTSFFGQHVQWVGAGLDVYGNSNTNGYNYVDNLFFHSLIEFGWVYTLGLFALYTAVAFKMFKYKEFFAVVLFAVLAMHFFLDDLCLMLDYNVLLFALGPYLFQKGDLEKSAGF